MRNDPGPVEKASPKWNWLDGVVAILVATLFALIGWIVWSVAAWFRGDWNFASIGIG